jgi:hypothetical protein
MEKLKVVFRKTSDGEIIAFFPEIPTNYGNIMSYMHIGQHGEASVDFYTDTKKATPEEYTPLLKELQSIYNDCILDIKQKLYHSELFRHWK